MGGLYKIGHGQLQDSPLLVGILNSINAMSR